MVEYVCAGGRTDARTPFDQHALEWATTCCRSTGGRGCDRGRNAGVGPVDATPGRADPQEEPPGVDRRRAGRVRPPSATQPGGHRSYLPVAQTPVWGRATRIGRGCGRAMNLLVPFAYPTTPHARRHGPRGYQDYGDYKPFLRDEFTFRCVYCLERELWYPNRDGSFSVDHFAPKVLHPDRERDFTNLVYACLRCNSVKQARLALLDPTAVPLGDHLLVTADGSIKALSPQGQQMIVLFHLDKQPATAVREECLLLLRVKREHPDNPLIHQLFLRKFGFPE